MLPVYPHPSAVKLNQKVPPGIEGYSYYRPAQSVPVSERVKELVLLKLA
jgi:hypothetical protein